MAQYYCPSAQALMEKYVGHKYKQERKSIHLVKIGIE